MFSKDFLESLGKAVEKLESRSSVELVVVAAKSSGRYQDVDHQGGFLAACAMVLVAVYSPREFAPEMLLFWVVAGYLLGYVLCGQLQGLRRWMTSPGRREQQVGVYARSAFVEKKLSSTRERTGLLLYLSEFERRGVLLGDLGVSARVPRALFNELEKEWAEAPDRAELERRVLAGLDRLVEPLAEALPVADDDENELPNEIYVEVGV